MEFNLIYGEKGRVMVMDSVKEKSGLSNANQTNPPRDQKSLSYSIAQKSEKSKPNPLRDLRLSKSIPQKEIVESVREMYPKYDKMLQSKCEHGELYGISLRSEAMDALLIKYAPEQLEAIKKKRRGGHRLTKKIACRLEDAEYEKLIKYTHEDGFDQMQAWLTWVVRYYLNKKAGKENNGQV